MVGIPFYGGIERFTRLCGDGVTTEHLAATPRPPSRQNRIGARPGVIDDFGLPRRTLLNCLDGVDEERFQMLRGKNESRKRVGGDNTERFQQLK